MAKSVYIAEKPSVAQEFAKAIKDHFARRDGYLESENSIVTWCVGHLVTMSYPESYDPALKRWRMETLPFIPQEFKYEVIPGVRKQFEIVQGLLTREDVDTIYVCTDSGREGEYIYRLVARMAGVKGKKEKRVWIDSQTEEEILKGIANAKDESEYDNLSASAYLRAIEDYLMGINFSRLLTLKYGRNVASFLKQDHISIAIGRVMTCVLGMVVRREKEIRNFVKTPFYRVLSDMGLGEHHFESEWRVAAGSKYEGTPVLYKENGFKTRQAAQGLIDYLQEEQPVTAVIESIEKKKENKNAPLLYNLAELQNDCSKLFKISPDKTLQFVQNLYEKKLVTYPRTDARVLSTAVCKEIHKNLNGLTRYEHGRTYAEEILSGEAYKNIARTRYCNDKQITDHYAIIPTGQGLNALQSLSQTEVRIYEIIVRRFLSIFYPPAVYQKVSIQAKVRSESFFSSFKVMLQEGYLKVASQNSFSRKNTDKETSQNADKNIENDDKKSDETEDIKCDAAFLELLSGLKKGNSLTVHGFDIKEGETTPPKRYNSGSMILAMENAGQLIEDEELRAQIKGSGIGTSATRAEILKKLNTKEYISTNSKTQIITPTLLGEIIYEVVQISMSQMLNPELTASWEKGLTMVSNGEITEEEYMTKLKQFIVNRTNGVLQLENQSQLDGIFCEAAKYYR
ncbi:MAG: DNA topoisomerase [Lachnospiraceae bacterium]